VELLTDGFFTDSLAVQEPALTELAKPLAVARTASLRPSLFRNVSRRILLGESRRVRGVGAEAWTRI
jgi:hypothetical protein